MFQSQKYKRLFIVLMGLALVILLAFYGLTVQDKSPFYDGQNQLRKHNQEKVVFFSIETQSKEKESYANDLKLETTAATSEITLERFGPPESSPKKQLVKNTLKSLKTFEKPKNTVRDTTDADFGEESTSMIPMSTTTDLGKDVKTQSTKKKGLMNKPLNPLEVSTKPKLISKPTKTQPDGDSDFQSTTSMSTLSSTSTTSKTTLVSTTVTETDIEPRSSQSTVFENSGKKLEDKTKGTDYISVKDRFVTRRKRYDRLCDKREYKDIKQTKYIISVRSQFANSRLRWCQIPKIATTFLKYVRRENAPSLIKQGVTRYSRSDRKSFFLVREPYSRLVSGYLCKIVTTPEFWKRYGLNIISKYRPNALEGSRNCGHDVSFPEFIKYFIKAQKTGLDKNKHFMPIHEQCSICRETYDYIVHLETLKPDLSYIFDNVGVNIDIDIRDTESEIISKSTAMMTVSNKNQNCFFPCQFLRKLWWSFQARGFVSTDKEFPFDDVECKTSSVKRFTELAINAYRQFTDKEKRSKQKRQMMVDFYLQLPLADRLTVRDILIKDFELFEYESEPKDIFPELFNNN